jgi:hypothetical protein
VCKHCLDVCKLCPCLDKESKNSARMRTIVTTALQWQYSQTELTFWITYVYIYIYIILYFSLYQELLGTVLKETNLSCSSLLPRKAVVAMRELLDTGVDFGWWEVAMNCEAEVCRNGSTTNYWALSDVTLQWHSASYKCAITFYNSVVTVSCIFSINIHL